MRSQLTDGRTYFTLGSKYAVEVDESDDVANLRTICMNLILNGSKSRKWVVDQEIVL
jgi:hypothetical protein